MHACEIDLILGCLLPLDLFSDFEPRFVNIFHSFLVKFSQSQMDC